MCSGFIFTAKKSTQITQPLSLFFSSHFRSVLGKERWRVHHFQKDPYQVTALTANSGWKKTDSNIKTAFFTHLQAFQRKKKPVINFKAVLQGV